MASDRTIISCPLHKAAQQASVPALKWQGRQISYKQLNTLVFGAVRELKKQGIAPEDRVAILADNSVEYVVVLLALWRMKAVAVPISIRLPLKKVEGLINKVNCRFCLSDDISQKICGSAKVVSLRAMVVFNVKEAFHEDQTDEVEIDLNQPATIMFTSGTSNEAKAVLQSYANHYYNALGSNENIALESGDQWLLALPLYHVAGIGVLMRCLLAQATMVLAQEKDLSLELNEITHVSLVVTQLRRIIKKEQGIELLRSLKVILLGGGVMPQSLMSIVLEHQLPAYVSYGMTEAASQIATGLLQEKDQACARVLPYRQVKINEEGEICIKGEVLFQGYVHGQQLLQPFDQEGWFATGDLGRLDDDYLTVSGRKDHMFISGGENIQPEEIERVLLQHPDVEQALVVGVEDDEFQARPVAFIQKEETLTVDQLIAFLEDYLPRFKIPIQFYAWPQDALLGGMKASRRYFSELIQLKKEELLTKLG